MGKGHKLIVDLERLLRLRTFPIGYKRLESLDELQRIANVRRFDHRLFCQMTSLARTKGWTIGITREDAMMTRCAFIHGISEVPEGFDGSDRAGVWFATEEDSRNQFSSYYHIPVGEAVVLAPLASEKFEPDVILIYGTVTQITLLINGLQWEGYAPLQFSCVGESSCSDGLARCYVTGKLSVAIPSYAERRFGNTQEDELALALPPNMLEKAINGLHMLSRAGLRYPIPPYGAEVDPRPALSQAYPQAARFKT